MPALADLVEELKRSDMARDAMNLLESALERRTTEEQGAFWRAVDLYYFSRKAPPVSRSAQQQPEPTAIA